MSRAYSNNHSPLHTLENQNIGFGIWLRSENPTLTLLKLIVNISAEDFLQVLMSRQFEKSVGPWHFCSEMGVLHAWGNRLFPPDLNFLWASVPELWATGRTNRRMSGETDGQTDNRPHSVTRSLWRGRYDNVYINLCLDNVHECGRGYTKT